MNTISKVQMPRRSRMKVKEGDVLNCKSKDCEIELTVSVRLEMTLEKETSQLRRTR
jgi:hypothetical protein